MLDAGTDQVDGDTGPGVELELQAARGSRPGIAFNGESEWQREFDASFPSQETPDQLTAIEQAVDPMRAAADKVSGRVAAAMEGRSADVVEITKHKA